MLLEPARCHLILKVNVCRQLRAFPTVRMKSRHITLAFFAHQHCLDVRLGSVGHERLTSNKIIDRAGRRVQSERDGETVHRAGRS